METKLVVEKELTKKIPVETHEGGIGQDDLENKQKSRGIIWECSQIF